MGGGLEKYLPVHNSIVIFEKLSIGGNLIIQLCIFSCKDKAMLGYNVFVMYLRAIGIFLLALKKYLKNITLGGPHLSEGGGSRKVRPWSTFFVVLFFEPLP